MTDTRPVRDQIVEVVAYRLGLGSNWLELTPDEREVYDANGGWSDGQEAVQVQRRQAVADAVLALPVIADALAAAEALALARDECSGAREDRLAAEAERDALRATVGRLTEDRDAAFGRVEFLLAQVREGANEKAELRDALRAAHRPCQCDLTEEEVEGHDCLTYAWEHQEAAMALYRVAADEAAALRATVDRVRALADGWARQAAALAPPDDWGDSMAETVQADMFRASAGTLRRVLDGTAQDADPFKPPYPCPTDGCSGDGRYAPPGRGHRSGCTYMQAVDAQGEPLTGDPQRGETCVWCLGVAAECEHAPPAGDPRPETQR